MIRSLIFLAIFLVCYPVSTFRRSGSRIMTPIGGSSNSIPQSNVPTQINGSMMLTTPASNPAIISAPPPITTGMVLSTVSATVTPVQVINSPVLFIFNDSFILRGSSPASNPPMAPGAASSSPPITTGTVISSPIQVVTSPIVLILNDSLMLNSSTSDSGSGPSSSANSVQPTAIIIDPASMMTGAVAPASMPSVTPAPVDITTFITSINESFILQHPTEITVTAASPISVTSPPLTTVTLPSSTTTAALPTSGPSPPLTTITLPSLTTTTALPISGTSPPLTTITLPSLTTTTALPISITSPPLTTITFPPLTTTTLESTPNIGAVTTGTPEASTITTTPLAVSTPVSGTIVPLMAASTITTSPSGATLDSAMTDTIVQPINSSTRYKNMRLVCSEATANEKTKASTIIVEPINILNASAVSPILGIVIPSEIKIYLNISSLPSVSVHISTEPPGTEVADDTVIVEIIRGNERFNISSQDVLSISVGLSPDPLVTEVTEEAVEIIEGDENISTSPQFQDIIFETTIENTVSEVPIYIDLSDPNQVDVDFGTTTSRPQISSTVPPVESTTGAPVTIPIVKKKFEENIPGTITDWALRYPVDTLRAIRSSPLNLQYQLIIMKECLEYYNIGKRTTRRTNVQVFIIGGENSGQKEFPHMAALGYGKQNQQQWLCGGSLISENYVITAAHCLSARSLGEIRYVRLGTTTLQTETLDSEDFNVIRRIPHPGYVQGKQFNDIALLQLDRPVNLSDYIAPICLSDVKDFTNTKLTALGWGRIEAEGNTSPELQKVDLDYFPNDVCRKAYDGISMEDLPGGISDDTQICAGAVDGSRDTCQGDSGGPLQIQRDGRMYLAGITSFGIGCARAESPGVYTRVSHYIPWIEDIIW